MYAMNPRDPKHRTPNKCCSIRPPNICHSQSSTKYEVALKEIRICSIWFSNVETMILYFKNNVCNESKGIQNIGLQINAVVYGLSVFEIPSHERNTKWPKTKHVQVGIGFPR